MHHARVPRRPLSLVLCLAALLLCAPAGAAGVAHARSPWRVVTGATTWFVTDGEDWAAWGRRDETQVVALRASTGRVRRFVLPSACRARGGPQSRTAAAGRVLLACGDAPVPRFAVLDLRTGARRLLPGKAMTGAADLVWTDLGRWWVEGAATCGPARCRLWFSLRTGKMRIGIESAPRDLDVVDLAPAPPCPALGAPMIALAGLAPYEARGVLRVRVPPPPATPVRSVERVGCGGDVLLGTEARDVASLSLRGGLASWTTAQSGTQVLGAPVVAETVAVATADGRHGVRYRLPAGELTPCGEAVPQTGNGDRGPHRHARLLRPNGGAAADPGVQRRGDAGGGAAAAGVG